MGKAVLSFEFRDLRFDALLAFYDTMRFLAWFKDQERLITVSGITEQLIITQTAREAAFPQLGHRSTPLYGVSLVLILNDSGSI